jgi:hypothetical protein
MDDDFDYGDEVVSAASSGESQLEQQAPHHHLCLANPNALKCPQGLIHV